MRSKKWSIIVSLIIMGVSVLIFSILNFRLYGACFMNWIMSFMSSTSLSEWKNFFIVISSGAFTSSSVTLLISIAEYRVEKETALEDYISDTVNFCADFYNMKYLDIDIPIELLQGYYAEQWKKPLESVLGNKDQGYIYDGEYIVPDSDVVTQIKEWLWKNTLNEEVRKEFQNPSIKREYLEAEFVRTIQKYDEEIDAVMKQYINLSDKVNCRKLTSSIGKIDFLFGNKYRKEVLYKKMYSRNREIVSKINDVSYHFKEYKKESEGNKPMMLRFIQDIQDYIFSIEEKEHAKIVHNQYLFEMKCEIDKALRKLYGKKRYHDIPPKKENFVVVSFWRNTDEFV